MPPKKEQEQTKESTANAVETIEETVNDVFGAASDDSFDFEKQCTEIFGGSYPRLLLQPNQVSQDLKYVKDTEIPLEGDPDENGKATTKMQTVYVVELPSGDMVTCPISAIFMKQFKEANIKIGDHFRIKRYPDAAKKRGKGAGNLMQVYAVGVTKRS